MTEDFLSSHCQAVEEVPEILKPLKTNGGNDPENQLGLFCKGNNLLGQGLNFEIFLGLLIFSREYKVQTFSSRSIG